MLQICRLSSQPSYVINVKDGVSSRTLLRVSADVNVQNSINIYTVLDIGHRLACVCKQIEWHVSTLLTACTGFGQPLRLGGVGVYVFFSNPRR